MTQFIYIAGPMTGLPNFNYPAFNEAARYINSVHGYEALNPTLNQPRPEKPALSREVYMRRGFELLFKADEVVTLAGWRDSVGAKLEIEVARALGLPIGPYRAFFFSTGGREQ